VTKNEKVELLYIEGYFIFVNTCDYRHEGLRKENKLRREGGSE